ncbi:unnamed protein product [Protopolystoma xenopodis]|uniref:SNF2 N-terminal domain-containing protein n=1 Tax=Protopolystoma xenopodis TaxID=117903 RepID=A0A448X9B8_9PLAT|nr:unnamed protein product [Protopolystoma xenopodis]
MAYCFLRSSYDHNYVIQIIIIHALQAMDRAHRIGQRRMVQVFRLVTNDTIEERQLNLQAFKRHLAETVISADNRSLVSMDTDHLLDRLSDALPGEPATMYVQRPSSIGAANLTGPHIADNSDQPELEQYMAEYQLEGFWRRLPRQTSVEGDTFDPI